MSSSDQDDILHLFNTQSKSSGPHEPAVDMADDPLAKILTRYRVLLLGLYWEV